MRENVKYFYFPKMLFFSTEVQNNKVELWCIRRFASKLNQTQYKGGFKGDNMLDKLANACKLDLSRRQFLNCAD